MQSRQSLAVNVQSSVRMRPADAQAVNAVTPFRVTAIDCAGTGIPRGTDRRRQKRMGSADVA